MITSSHFILESRLVETVPTKCVETTCVNIRPRGTSYNCSKVRMAFRPGEKGQTLLAFRFTLLSNCFFFFSSSHIRRKTLTCVTRIANVEDWGCCVC